MVAFATPAELAAHTKGLISPTDGRSQLILDGASAAIRRYCGWNIAPAEDVSATLDGGGRVLYLPTLKLNSVESIVIGGTELLTTSYEWSRLTGNVRRIDGDFPETWGSVVVSYNSGYASTPADLKQIVLQQAALALSSPTGATREQAGQVSRQWATTAPGVAGGLTLLDRDLRILSSYKLPKEA